MIIFPDDCTDVQKLEEGDFLLVSKEGEKPRRLPAKKIATNIELNELEEIALSGENIVRRYEGGYVRESPIASQPNMGLSKTDEELHKYIITPVTFGQKWVFISDREHSLNSFLSEQLGRVGESFKVSEGYNEILVPSGVSYLAFTLEFSPNDDTTKKRGNWRKQALVLKTAYVDAIFNALEKAQKNITDNNSKVSVVESSVNHLSGLFDSVLSDKITYRENKGESTQHPIYFGEKVASSNSPSISFDKDMDSPFKDSLPFCRVFNNTSGSTPVGVMYIKDKIKLGQERPEIITISYWVKEEDVRAIWTSNGIVYMSVVPYVFKIIEAINNIGVKQVVKVTIDKPEYSKGELTVYFSEKRGEYVKLVQEFRLDWKDTFVGKHIDYYFIFNKLQNFLNYPLRIYNFTILFEEINNSILIYPDRDNEYPQVPQGTYQIKEQINALKEQIGNNVEDDSFLSRFQVIDGTLFFANKFGDSKELVRIIDVNRKGSFDENPNVNLRRTTLIKRGDSFDSGGWVKTSGDDICPAKLNGSYIGGNHGWAHARILTFNNHGKTFADIGSEWKDSKNVIFIILRIVDADKMWIVSENQATDGYSYSFVSPSGNLEHKSGALNTASIVGYAIANLNNLYNTVQNNRNQLLINGRDEVSDASIHNCSFLDIVEDYDIFDLPSTIEKLIEKKPSGGYAENVALNSLGAEKLFNHNITYRLLPNGTTLIFHNFFTYKKLKFEFHGFIQAGKVNKGKIYIPKTKPISDGTKTFDFTKIEDWDGSAKRLYFSNEYWELENNPPDRILNFNDDVNFHIGYLFDRGVGLKRKSEMLGDALFLNTNGKMYPFGLKKSMPLEANNFYSCVCFRQWTNRAENPNGRTNFSWFSIGESVYIYLDYHKTILDTIEMKEEWAGKKIVVAEKSENISILSEVVSNEIRVSCQINSENVYGYAVLVLK